MPRAGFRHNYSCWVWLAGLAACHSAGDQSAQSAASLTSSPGTAYYVYRSLLPGQADSITLHLVSVPAGAAGDGTSSFGSYYGSDGQPFRLSDERPYLNTAADSLVFSDSNPDSTLIPTDSYWRLKPQPDGSLTGTVGLHAVRLRLAPAAPGGLTFVVRYFADSLAAFPGQNSPKDRISLQALVPVGGPAGVRAALYTNMLRDLRGDTISSAVPLAPEALFKQERATFFTYYRQAVKEQAPNGNPGKESFYALNYVHQLATYLRYHQGNLLSLEFTTYDYWGGAHGGSGTIAASYDLRTGRRLRYADIFRPRAAEVLPRLLEQAARKELAFASDVVLYDQQASKHMPVPHNVFLTAGGVEFIYETYALGPGGEVHVFLPLAQVRPLLRENLPF